MHVTLEPLTVADVNSDYLDWMLDENITRFLEARFLAHTIKSLEDYVRQSSACQTERLYKILAMQDEDHSVAAVPANPLSPVHVGNLRLHNIDLIHGTAEVGLLVGDLRFQGKGVGTRALRLAESLSIQNLGLRKLTAGCYSSNTPSRRAFIRAGYRELGVRLNQYRLESGFDHQVLFERILDDQLPETSYANL